ncbi:hypothetical protein [Arcticibacterium luteifluviistationis]|uniref:Bacterial surface antigen (D15) domain-containing protein n=1 Tax=Arcticibacterium luteifluviistationis TaxID=1784714 RepID=A0A2Z4GB43_9BACT|nr:hypothetical protein [Arcticibacterium luteifluviistationis]AWV98153.1 hypothetical protein DJ013_08195 [Arcticibacterium luteifluviistationis]
MKNVFTLLLLLGSMTAFSQGYYSVTQETFGRNRIQLRKLDWKTINSNNFEFNYYRGGQDIAMKAAKIAEGEYRKITEILGYTPFTTMKIFLYNTPRQMEQSNIGLTTPIEYDGGILNLSRSRIEIPYTGNDSIFKTQLVEEISGLFVYDMLYGGSLKEVLQSSLLLTVPEWYMSGIAAYIAKDGMTTEDLDKVKETILRNDGKKLNHLSSEDAEVIGQSIWHYIAERYGRDNISNILNLTRIIRAEQSSITSTLGISFNRFIEQWKAYYLTNGASAEPKSVVVPSPDDQKPNFNKNVNQVPKLANLKDGEVDTEHYEFEEVNVLKSKELLSDILPEQTSTFNRSRLTRDTEEFKISPPKAYQNLLLTQDLKTEIFNDPVRRLGLNASLSLNDLLENHVIDFNLFITPTLKNHDIKASYFNYEKRVDWGLTFERRSLILDTRTIDKQSYIFNPLNFVSGQLLNRRIILHKLVGTVSYPLSQNLKVNFLPTVFFNNDIDYFEVSNDIRKNSYAGVKAEIVYDNTKKLLGDGFLSGTRAKVSYQKNIAFSNPEENFNGLNIDLRHYQNLTPGIQFAGRFNFGNSYGMSPKYTFLGGMENTLNRDIYSSPNQIGETPGNLKDIVFYNYAGNLRGFDFAKLYGTKHILVNLEIRLSLANYFSKNTVTSSMIRNLQLVLFNDIGTAWNGDKGPWSRQNSLNTQVIGGSKVEGVNSPFYAVVTNFKNPFLSGYGGGIRTTILGFFVKADYAFGLENKELSKGKFYLSLGHDF